MSAGSARRELLEEPRLQGSTSETAKNRRQFYQDAIEREQRQHKFGDDYLGFLSWCGIELTIRAPGADDIERMGELAQRTNQLNFSGNKYSRHDVAAFFEDPVLERYLMECRDRFGSYGTVGLAIVRRSAETLTVEDFMLSCRVQGKMIEQAFLGYLLQASGQQIIHALHVNFRQTERNSAAQQVLEGLGFRPSPDGGMSLTSFDSLRSDVVVVKGLLPPLIQITTGAVSPAQFDTIE